MDSTKGIVDKINQNWYSLTLINILVLGVLMLFYSELSTGLKKSLIPSLVVYIIGTSIIGYIQGTIFRSKGMVKGFKEPILLYIILHIVWFVLLLLYLFCKSDVF